MHANWILLKFNTLGTPTEHPPSMFYEIGVCFDGCYKRRRTHVMDVRLGEALSSRLSYARHRRSTHVPHILSLPQTNCPTFARQSSRCDGDEQQTTTTRRVVISHQFIYRSHTHTEPSNRETIKMGKPKLMLD